MIPSEKPKKRVIIYWFFERGFFFLIFPSLILGFFLHRYYGFYALSVFLVQFSLVLLPVSLILLFYEWGSTEYFFMKKHLVLKKAGEVFMIPYSSIKKVGYYGTLLQHLMGTTNVVISTLDNKEYVMPGVRDYKGIENRILSKIS